MLLYSCCTVSPADDGDAISLLWKRAMRKAILILTLALGGATLLQPAAATTDVTMQTFWAASGGDLEDGSADGINLFWYMYPYPFEVGATVAGSTVSAWVWNGSPPASMAEGHYAVFNWTSAYINPNIYAGVLYAGVPFRRYCSQSTGNLEVMVRVSVNETDRPSDFKIYLEDDDGRQAASSSLIGSLSDATWTVLTATFDLSASPFSSSATENLRAFIEAKGTTTSGNIGSTEVDVEYIAVRQYND